LKSATALIPDIVSHKTSTNQSMKDVEEYCPNNKQDWRKWPELNHNKKEAIWLI